MSIWENVTTIQISLVIFLISQRLIAASLQKLCSTLLTLQHNLLDTFV